MRLAAVESRDLSGAMASFDIEAVMVLALEAVTPKVREWAAKWLADRCNVIVCERNVSAATAATNDLR